MKGQLSDKIRIQHILDPIGETQSYLRDASFEDFI